jgi:hypothetical protein
MCYVSDNGGDSVSNGEMKRKPVVFNLADDHQRKLYEHASRSTNFSYYIKSLIQRDMERSHEITARRYTDEPNGLTD